MSYASDAAEGDYAEALAEAPIRWCGICFSYRPELDGRCTVCGNAHMRGGNVAQPFRGVCTDCGATRNNCTCEESQSGDSQ